MTETTKTEIGYDYESNIKNGFFIGAGLDHKETFSQLKQVFEETDINTFNTDEDKMAFQQVLDWLKKEEEISSHMNDFSDSEFSLSHQEYDWLLRNSRSTWVDYIVYRYKFKTFPNKHLFSEVPIHILVEPTSVCNLKCVMCFQVDSSFTTREHMGMMDYSLFEKVVTEAAKCGTRAITLASRGEPTLHKKFPEMLSLISELGFLDVKVNTNATRLTPELSRSILQAGVNELVFSVDAGTKETYESIRVKGKFDRVVENIATFHKIRDEEFPDSKTVTRISGVKVNDEQDIQQMYTFWSEIVDQVAIKEALPRWDTYNNELTHRKNACHLLWERVYVWYDGTVNPCDFDYKSYLSVGNLKNTSLREIWNGQKFKELRTQHEGGRRTDSSPCDRCPM